MAMATVSTMSISNIDVHVARKAVVMNVSDLAAKGVQPLALLAPKLKWAGIDIVLISGRSERPVYLYIDEEGWGWPSALRLLVERAWEPVLQIIVTPLSVGRRLGDA